MQAPASASKGISPQQALFATARAGNTSTVESLLQQGATLNAADETSQTALILAAINSHSAIAEKLLALGANRRPTDQEGLDALQHASRLGLARPEALLQAGH